jgi:hypothetical protein
MHRVSAAALWIGNAGDLWDLGPVLDAGIAAVVDLAVNEPAVKVTRELVYCRLPLVDGGGNPAWLLRAALDVTVSLLRSRTPTLVCCSTGMSRSPAVAAAALAIVHEKDPLTILQALAQEGPHDVSPALWLDLLGLLPRAGATPPDSPD